MIEFDTNFGMYVYELDGILFCWEEMPEDGYEETAKSLAESYKSNFDLIAQKVFEDIKEMYSLSSVDEVKANLGRPQIDPEMEEVSYCEHTFDEEHVISFEYEDGDMSKIGFITVNG